MRNDAMITLLNPGKIVFGQGSLDRFITDYLATGLRKLFIVTLPAVASQLSAQIKELENKGVETRMNESIKGEPSFTDFEDVLEEARSFGADSVAGIGGGSILDTAKLVAAQLSNGQTTAEIKGIGNLKERKTYLACIPTTSGTGSEMSPNAIFLDDQGNKIGVISPHLVPDASYIDPSLTLSVPASITASTGIDALAHCLEAYINKFAHPVIDVIALEGVRLIGSFLKRACTNGVDIEARTAIALGSMYGGMCLGPVNTTAVHALAYPLGADYHLAHGLSIALLLPAVMRFNLPAAPARHALLALAMGVERRADDTATAKAGINAIENLIRECGLPGSLEEAGVKHEAIDKMAADAMKVQRLLNNNVREVNQNDATAIYRSAFSKL